MGYFDNPNQNQDPFSPKGPYDQSAELLYGSDAQKNMPYTNGYSGLAGMGANATDQNGFWGDTFKSIDNLLPMVGGLASMYMQWDKLQAEKSRARDAHNANAKIYNNQLTRSNSVGKSIYGDDYKQKQTNVAKSTI